MDIITNSLTNWIQKADDSIEVPGIVWILATVIRIRWVWLSFPIALVVLGAVFLIAIAMSSYKNNMPTRKSSLMPLLFHRVEGWSDDEIRNIRQGGLEDKGGMQKKATTNVQLVRNDS